MEYQPEISHAEFVSASKQILSFIYLKYAKTCLS